MMKKTISRRKFLQGAVGVGGMMMAAAAGGGTPSPPTQPAPGKPAQPAAAGGPVNLVFIGGSFEPQVVQANLQRFDQQYPDIKVSYTAEPALTFTQKLIAMYTGPRQMDLSYVGDDTYPSWAQAGWLEPLDDRPEMGGYKKDLKPYVLEGLTYKGKMYGLPYYTDYLAFIYNQKMIQQAGFGAPPKTWDEVKTQALAIKKARIVEFPLVTALLKGHVGTFGTFWAMVYAGGGKFFDQDMKPLFAAKGGPAQTALEWLVDAHNTWKILDPTSMQLSNDTSRDAVAAGQSAFVDNPRFNLQRLNDPKFSKIAGDAKMAMFPTWAAGQQSATYGWVRAYSIARKSRYKEQAWKLLQYVGGKDKEGKYYTAKDWYLKKALGYAYKPLNDDPEIAAATKQWGDPELMAKQAATAKIRENINTVWYGEWEPTLHTKVQEALLKKISPTEALADMAKKAEQLRKEWA